MASDLSKTKEIKYNGGVVTFSVPIDWKEEYGDDGGGTFYEDSPTSGTFRINLLTLRSPSQISKKDVGAVLDGISPSETTKFLENGNAYKMYKNNVCESGQEITIIYWSLANVIEPNNARLANFSYSVLTENETNENVIKEIKFLTEQIEKASFMEQIANGI
ncbi:hypothetical protein [Arenicella xantha]|uniref:Uncharacterized protein n=1 Tax=Arenicella xantha TaxID=644221 RepID=A0A395JHA5_9GAMM|nr:hypothetical protein [Arenicella xantha]RBP47009.1 hypothetical protein DFR28_1133 [Arenicella xantha]